MFFSFFCLCFFFSVLSLLVLLVFFFFLSLFLVFCFSVFFVCLFLFCLFILFLDIADGLRRNHARRIYQKVALSGLSVGFVLRGNQKTL